MIQTLPGQWLCMLKMAFESLCLFERKVRWGDHKISPPLYRGDCKILYPFDRGDRKINKTNFARFFRPPAPVVNEPPLTRGKSPETAPRSMFQGHHSHLSGYICKKMWWTIGDIFAHILHLIPVKFDEIHNRSKFYMGSLKLSVLLVFAEWVYMYENTMYGLSQNKKIKSTMYKEKNSNVW